MTTHYYTKSYNTQANDLRQDRKPLTTALRDLSTIGGSNPNTHRPTTPPTTEDRNQTQKMTAITKIIDNKTTSRWKKDVAIQLLSATLQLNKKNKMLYAPLQFSQYENCGLPDTGVIQSAKVEDEIRRITAAHPASVLE